MNLYPALKARMGRWEYYVVKMQMKDLVTEVGFASEMYNDKTLDNAIQRSLGDSPVKKDIVQYLGKRDDRFLSSIVVAALGGNPTYAPIDITDDPKFALLKPAGISDSFGVLTFDGGQRCFALDGQHRLKAIKTLLEQNEPNDNSHPRSTNKSGRKKRYWTICSTSWSCTGTPSWRKWRFSRPTRSRCVNTTRQSTMPTA